MDQQISPETMFMKIGVLSIEIDMMRATIVQLKNELDEAHERIKEFEKNTPVKPAVTASFRSIGD
jgi:CRISPR/Cas system-associated protein Cas7 (RAMP superfamily)